MTTNCCYYGWIITGKGATPCACAHTRKSSTIEARAKIPARYKESSLETYIPQGDIKSSYFASQLRAKIAAQDVVKNFPTEGILLMGGCGTGKTHLAVAILRTLIKKGLSGMFCDVASLLTQIQATWSNKQQSPLEAVCRSPILLLDEIGGEKNSNWSRETVAEIINYRYNNELFTIVTTNYTDDSTETLSDRIGQRSRSRLHQMARTVLIYGNDYRSQPRHTGLVSTV